MDGHWPGHVDWHLLCQVVLEVDQVVLDHVPELVGFLLGLGVPEADQGVLGHLPVLAGFLLGGQAGVYLLERELPVALGGPPEDTKGRRRPKVQGRPGDLL